MRGRTSAVWFQRVLRECGCGAFGGYRSPLDHPARLEIPILPDQPDTEDDDCCCRKQQQKHECQQQAPRGREPTAQLAHGAAAIVFLIPARMSRYPGQSRVQITLRFGQGRDAPNLIERERFEFDMAARPARFIGREAANIISRTSRDLVRLLPCESGVLSSITRCSSRKS